MTVERARSTDKHQDTISSDEPRPRLFTVDEYYKMAEVGILKADERVELIEGEIVEMPPIGPRHAYNVDRLTRLFLTRVGGRAEIRGQHPLRLAGGAEPEPDLAVVRSDPNDPKAYASRHPEATDALLVIEVADSTVVYDLGEKAQMYARRGIVELWVVDLPGDRLVVHREPTPDGYASVTVMQRGEMVSALAFPDISFTADEILG